MIRLTTLDLISDVRSLIDETTDEAAHDVTDILAALNRAQNEAVAMICNQYDDILATSKSYTYSDITSGSVPFPENTLEDRIQKVEVKVSGGYWCSLIPYSYRDAARLELPTTATYVHGYYTKEKRLHLLPQTISSANLSELRVWYSKEPDKLVKPLATVSAVSSTAVPYVHITDSSVDFVSTATNTDSYVNVVDGETGNVKCTLQIASKVGDRLTFRTSPQRSSVFGRTVSSALPTSSTANPDQEIKPDDYICSAEGTCVPFMKGVYSNFLTQSAALDIKRKLGDAEVLPVELQLKDNFAKYVKGLWAGRQNNQRIRSTNDNWIPDSSRQKIRRVRR